MSVNQAQCGAHPHCVPENTDTGYGIEKRITHNFFLKNNLDKLAPGESKIRREPKLVSRCHCEVSPSQDELVTL